LSTAGVALIEHIEHVFFAGLDAEAIDRQISGARNTRAMIQGDRLGRVVRAVRVRLQLRQIDVARRAGVSAGAISRIERGRLDQVSLTKLSKVADVLEIRLEIVARWRGGDLDRMINAAHAALAEDVVAWISSQPGWEVRPEISFNVYGERGVIDLIAWHAATRALLVIELKTDIVDVGETLGTFDRKRRLAARVAAELGWRPAVVGAALLVRDSRTNRRRVEAYGRTLRAALPDDGRRLKRWLGVPSGTLAALAFVPDRQHLSARHRPATNRRVRLPRKARDESTSSVMDRRDVATSPALTRPRPGSAA
jgi:transcriptional regulator with XRE-family HTH domain